MTSIKKYRTLVVCVMIFLIIEIIYSYKDEIQNLSQSQCVVDNDTLYKKDIKDEVSEEKLLNKEFPQVDGSFKKIYDDDKLIADNSCGAFFQGGYQPHTWNKEGINEEFIGYYGAFDYWVLDVKEAGKITLDYNFKFNGEGKYKLLLCNPKKKLVKIFENTTGKGTEKSKITIATKKGINTLKRKASISYYL